MEGATTFIPVKVMVNYTFTVSGVKHQYGKPQEAIDLIKSLLQTRSKTELVFTNIILAQSITFKTKNAKGEISDNQSILQVWRNLKKTFSYDIALKMMMVNPFLPPDDFYNYLNECAKSPIEDIPFGPPLD